MFSDDFPNDDWSLDLAWDYYARAKYEIDTLIERATSADVNLDGADSRFEDSQVTFPIGEIDSLVFLGNLLNKFDSTAYGSALAEETEISPVALSKVIKGRGYLTPHDAISLLDRLKTLLLKIENDVPDHSQFEEQAAVTPESITEQTENMISEKWTPKSESAEVGQLIDALTRNLEDVVEIIQRNNSLAEMDGVSQLRLNRLKAVLKTALLILDAPMVETGLLKTASTLASEAGKEFVKDEMKKGLGNLLQIVSEQAMELYVKLTVR